MTALTQNNEDLARQLDDMQTVVRDAEEARKTILKLFQTKNAAIEQLEKKLQAECGAHFATKREAPTEISKLLEARSKEDNDAVRTITNSDVYVELHDRYKELYSAKQDAAIKADREREVQRKKQMKGQESRGTAEGGIRQTHQHLSLTDEECKRLKVMLAHNGVPYFIIKAPERESD